MNTASDTSGHAAADNAYRFEPRFARNGDYLWWAKTPGFNPFKLIAVIAGFAIFPPLGIAALIYFLWIGKRWRHGAAGGERWAGHGCRGGRHGMGRTGNAAFDEQQAKAREELDAERRAFEEFRAEERRKRDAAAFEAFKASRPAPNDDSQT